MKSSSEPQQGESTSSQAEYVHRVTGCTLDGGIKYMCTWGGEAGSEQCLGNCWFLLPVQRAASCGSGTMVAATASTAATAATGADRQGEKIEDGLVEVATMLLQHRPCKLLR